MKSDMSIHARYLATTALLLSLSTSAVGEGATVNIDSQGPYASSTINATRLESRIVGLRDGKTVVNSNVTASDRDAWPGFSGRPHWYELMVIPGTSSPGRAQSNQQGFYREDARFRIETGTVVPFAQTVPVRRRGNLAVCQLQIVPASTQASFFAHLGSMVVDFFIPRAAGEDLTILDSSPTLFFDDSSDTSDGPEWSINGDDEKLVIRDTGNDSRMHFYIDSGSAFYHYLGVDLSHIYDWSAERYVNWWSSGTPFLITQGSEFSIKNQDTNKTLLWSDATGDMELVGGYLFVDGSTGNIGVRTTFPEDDLHISSSQPGILLDDPFHGSRAEIVNNLNLTFRIDTDQDNSPDGGYYLARGVRGDGQTDALLGIGMPYPISKLHIVGADGASIHENTTKLYLQNNSTIKASRVMMELENYGNPMLIFTNTEANERWQVNPIGKSFVISRGGTGVQEARVTANGDLIIAGLLAQGSSREIKENFTTLDGRGVLAQLEELPVQAWNYKADDASIRHVGPTAEDFHAAFGLGQDTKTTAPSDLVGISIVAIKALRTENKEIRAENEKLQARVEALEALIEPLIASAACSGT